MTEEAQRIAIAIFAGWTSKLVPQNEEMAAARDGTGIYEGNAGYPIGGGPGGGMQFTWWKNPGGKYDTLPDYPRDLNAMHEAEKLLGGPTDYRWCGYMTYLQDVCAGGSRVSATAAQRAEALLRTIGKWADS